jgi:alkylated DNA repair protein (DNA oxidative demethylase)
MSGSTGDLFDQAPRQSWPEPIVHGATVLRRWACAREPILLEELRRITDAAPFRHMFTPAGHRMSVAMSSCGAVGWVTDQRGYRYARLDPASGRPWPEMPNSFAILAREAAALAGFDGFAPDSCLINRYEPGTRLSLHQDRNERDFAAPVVSVSLGLPAVFLFGGLERNIRPRRIRLASGDVVVWGGPARKHYHGIEPVAEGDAPATGQCRINLTFRKAL